MNNGPSEELLRNSGFISSDTQNRLEESVILIAGCGSIGGSSVELLVRTGARKLILTDPDFYDYTNLNRQSAGYSDVGRNKAELMAEKALWVNPKCKVTVYAEGLTKKNISDILATVDIIVDGIDVTTHSGWEAKFALHQAAKRYRIPVISGYDMDLTQYTIFHDYRKAGEALFKGRINEKQARDLPPLDTCLLLIKPENMPLGIFEELERISNGEKSFISQLGVAANLFGVISVSIILKILNGRQVKDETYMDMYEILDSYTSEEISRLEKFRLDYSQKITDLQKEAV